MRKDIQLELTVLFLIAWIGTSNGTFDVRKATGSVGCYLERPGDRRLTGYAALADTDQMTIPLCREECRNMNYSYAGVAAGWQCFCGRAKPVSLSSACTAKCEGDDATVCGGEGGNVNVYTVLPPLKTLDILLNYRFMGKNKYEPPPADFRITAWSWNNVYLNMTETQTSFWMSLLYADGRGPDTSVRLGLGGSKRYIFMGSGEQFIGVAVKDVEENTYYAMQTAKVDAPSVSSYDIEVTSPRDVNISAEFDFDILIRLGENMTVTVDFEPGQSASIQDGETSPRILKPNRMNPNATLVKIPATTHTFFWNDIFRENATLKGLDINAISTGSSYFYLLRPQCSPQDKLCMRSYRCIPLAADCSKQVTNKWAIKCESAANETYDFVYRKCRRNGFLIDKHPFNETTEIIAKFKVIRKYQLRLTKGGNYIYCQVNVQVGDMYMIDDAKSFNQIPRDDGETITADVNKGFTSDLQISMIKKQTAYPELYPVILRPLTSRFQYTYSRDVTNHTINVTVSGSGRGGPANKPTLVSVMAPIKNLTVFCPEAAPVSENFTCTIPPHQGTEVFYDWYYDNDTALAQTDDEQNMTFANVGISRVTLVAYNGVSKAKLTKWIFVQRKVEGLHVITKPATLLGEASPVSWAILMGTNVSYEITLGDEGKIEKRFDPNVTLIELSRLTYTYKTVGHFQLIVNASNKVSFKTYTKTIKVQAKIKGLAFSKILAMEKGKNGVFGFVTTEGTDLNFSVTYKKTPSSKFRINCSPPYRAGTFTGPASIFPAVQNYSITMTGKNFVSTLTTPPTDVVVNEKLVGLTVKREKEYATVNTNTKITAKVTSGTGVWITADYGDGEKDSVYISVFSAPYVFIHQYNDSNTYTVTVTAENPLGGLKESITIITQYPVDNVLLKSTSPGALTQNKEDAEITISLTIPTGEPAPTNAEYECVFSSNDKKRGKLNFTNGMRDITIKRMYKIPGDNKVSCNIKNEVSAKPFNEVIEIDEQIENLRLEAYLFSTVVGTEVTFTMSMIWGSRVTASIDFKDGSPVVRKALQKQIPKNITHLFKVVGTYRVLLTATNKLGPTHVTVKSPLVVQVPISEVLIGTPTGFPTIRKGETYKAEFYIKIKSGSKTPSSVFYSINFDDGSPNKTGQNPESKDSTCSLAAGCEVVGPIKHDYKRGDAFNVSVNVWNLVSNGSCFVIFDVYAYITGLRIHMEVCRNGKCHGGIEGGTQFPDYERISFGARTDFASHMDISWDFGDSNTKTTKKINITYAYVTKNQKSCTIILKAMNKISKQTSTKSITLFRAIGDAWHDLGKTAVRNFTTTVGLNTGRNGLDPCYFFDFGDKSPLMRPGRYVLFGSKPICKKQHAAAFKNEPDLEVHPIATNLAREIKKVNAVRVEFNITMMTLGRLSFVFIAANKVSERKDVRPLAIAKGPCYLPKISLGPNKTELWRSRPYTLLPSVFLNCSSTNLANHTLHIYQLGNDNVTIAKVFKGGDFLPDNIQLNSNDNKPKLFSAKTFEYGFYKITFNVSMYGEIGLWSFDEMILEVVPSPLKVKIGGGMDAIAKFGTNITIDATNHTYDPDIKRTDQSNLRYIWMCKRYCETWPVYSMDLQTLLENSTNSCPPDNVDLASLMTPIGCFAYSKNDAVEPGTLNTTWLMVDENPGTLRLDGTQLREGENGTLNIKVIVYKDDGLGREGRFEQALKVMKGDPPAMELKWGLSEVKNVGLNVRKITVPVEEWAAEASTGITTSNLALNASPFFKQFANLDRDKIFNLELNCRRFGTPDWGIVSYVFAVNRLPNTKESNCYSSPSYGMAVRDKFNIKCDGKFVDEDLPLTYKIAYKIRPDDDKIWVYAGGAPTLPEGALIPQGDPAFNYYITLLIQAVDNVGGYSQLDFKVKVVPADEETIKRHLGNFQFVESYIDTAIANGNVGTVCQMAALFGSYLAELRTIDQKKLEEAQNMEATQANTNGLNTGRKDDAGEAQPAASPKRRKREVKEPPTGNAASGDKTNLPQAAPAQTKFTNNLFLRNTNERAMKRIKVIRKFSAFAIDFLATLNQVIPALGMMTMIKEELTLDAQEVVLEEVKSYGNVVKLAAEGGESADLIEESTRGILSIIGDVSNAAGHNGTIANKILKALNKPESTDLPLIGEPTPEPPTIDPELTIQEVKKDPILLDKIRDNMQSFKIKVKQVVQYTQNLTSDLLETIQKNKVAGESPTILTTKATNISCIKQFTEKFAEAPVNPGGASQINMPSTEGMFGPANESTPSVEAIASSMKGNPFTYGNSSSGNGTAPPAVSGNVVSFSIKNASGDPMVMSDLAEPFVMVIPQTDPELTAVDNFTSTEKIFKKIHMVTMNPTCTLAINVIDVNDTWWDDFSNETDSDQSTTPAPLSDTTESPEDIPEESNITQSEASTAQAVPKEKNKIPEHMRSLQGVDDVKKEVRYIMYLKIGKHPTFDNYDFNCTLPQAPNDYELGLIEPENTTLPNVTESTTSTTTPAPTTDSTDSDNSTAPPKQTPRKKLPPPKRDLNTCHFSPNDMNITETTNIFIGVYAVPYNLSTGDYNLTNFVESKYRLAAYMVGCLYFDEENEVWSNNGCTVSQKTTPELTVCECNHLTNFGSAFAVPMNPIDLSSPGFGDLNKNPTVFATYVCSIIMYCVLMIWAIKADRIDELKAGATPLPDNDPRDKYLYELLVTTGDQPNAGSTAQVSFILIGEDNETEPRVLMDERRTVLQSGDTDTFVLAVPAPLGNLSTLRVWHDDGGKSPGWFFFQMLVTDLQTKEKTFFICQRWLARNEDDSLIDRVIPAAGLEEMTDFNYLFWTKAKKDLTDGHIWISVFKRPAKSKFSRVQRLTCCLLLLYSSMLSSLMFFGSEPENPPMIKMGPIQISLYTVQVGIVSGLVVVPVNVLIVFLFRYARDPPKDLLASKKKHKGLVYNADRTSLDSVEIELQKEKEYLDTGKRNLDMQQDPPGVSYIENKDGVPRVAMAMKEAKPKKKPFSLPWQTLIAAYIIVAVSCSTAFYFAVKFGQGMGYKKTVRWIQSFSLGTIQSVIVQEPIKIIVLAAFYAIVLKKPDEGEDSELEPDDLTLKDDEEYMHDHPTEKDAEMEGVKEKIAQYKVLPEPPDEGMLREVRQQKKMQSKMMGTIWNLIFYVIYLLFLSLVAADIRDNNSFNIYNNFKNMFDRDTFTLNTASGSHTASSIRTHDQFWDWAIHSVVPGSYGRKWFKEDPWLEKYRHFLADRVHFRVGPVRIRQVRSADEPCEERVITYGIGLKCRFSYSLPSEDTGNYRRGWIPVNETDPNDKPDEGWGFKGAIELRSAPKSGLITMYGGGGYVLYLGDTAAIAKSRLEEFRKMEWVDKRTRGVSVEFLAYNPIIKLYFCSEIIIEFMETGAAVPYYEGHVLKLLSGTDPNAMASMLLLFIFFGFIVYFFVQEVKKMKILGKEYFSDFWNNYEFTIIMLSFFAILMSIGRFMIAYDMGETMKDRSKFINMAYILLWDKTAAYLLAIISFLSVLKCLRLLRFNKDVAGLFAMMNYVAAPLADFMVVFFVIFTSFCMVTFFVFNTHLEEYKTYVTTFETLLSMMLNKFDAKRLTQTSPVLGSLIFFSFVLAINFLMINFMLAIIMEAFVICSEEISEQDVSKDHEIVSFMVTSFKKVIGLEKSPPPFQQECRLRYVEGANNSTDVACNEMMDKMDKLMDRFENYVSKQVDNKEIMEEWEAIQQKTAKAKKKKRTILTG